MKKVRLLVKLFAMGAAAIASMVAHAEAPKGFTFVEIAGCSATSNINAYSNPDSLKASRTGPNVLVTVNASLNCGAGIQPTVKYGRGAVSISVTEQYPKNGPVAACNCMRSFRFTLTEPVKSNTPIYLVNRGDASAHVVAP